MQGASITGLLRITSSELQPRGALGAELLCRCVEERTIVGQQTPNSSRCRVFETSML